MKTVYRFRIYYKKDDGTLDLDHAQFRWVLAEDEGQAERKMEAYKRKMVKDGFCNFVVGCANVELENVIC